MNNIRNTETGEWGLGVNGVRAWFEQQGTMACIADAFEGVLEPFESYAATPQPEHDPETHKVVQLEPAGVEGVLTQRWEAVPLTQAEIDAARKALVPAVVTRRQARQALLMAGLLTNVQPAIDALEDPMQRGMAQIEWDDSQEFTRDRPLLIQLATALGLDDVGLDNLFIQAGGL